MVEKEKGQLWQAYEDPRAGCRAAISWRRQPRSASVCRLPRSFELVDHEGRFGRTGRR